MSEEEKKQEPIGEILGEIPCPDCSGVAYVKRTKRRGNHYMSNCPDCGIDQRTGAAQSRMAKYVPVGTLKAKGQISEKAPEVEEVEPDLTGAEPVQSEPSKPAAKPRKIGLFAVLGVVALAAVGLSN